VEYQVNDYVRETIGEGTGPAELWKFTPASKRRERARSVGVSEQGDKWSSGRKSSPGLQNEGKGVSGPLDQDANRNNLR